MIKKILTGIVVFILAVVIFVLAYLYLNKSPEIFKPSVGGLYNTAERPVDKSTVREIESGIVAGFADAYDTHAWIGIPYAAAPVGDLRWRAPQPAISWVGQKNATEYGSPCVQFWGGLAGTPGKTGEVVGSEDCLTLNIWSPKTSDQQHDTSNAKKPVMVWIHGGNNDSGTANIFQGHHLAGTKDVTVVVINYRVGLLGWFSHDAVRNTSDNLEDASGNFGTLDIIAALKWVQRNISQFGGDPDNVTIFGESAGGRNVFSLLASPLAKGLFHKAISQSGTADTTSLILAEEFADPNSTELLSGLKNSSNGIIETVMKSKFVDQAQAQIRDRISRMPSAELMAEMRNVDAKRLMELANANTEFDGYIQTANVLRDGHVIPKESTMALFNDPSRYNSVPMILGANRDENKLFMSNNPEYVSFFLGIFPQIKNSARYNRISKFVSDNWKAGAVDEPAKRISKTSAANVYAYRFDWDDSPSNWLIDLPDLIGAAHGIEISFVFGDFKGGTDLSFLVDKSNAQGRKQLSLQMMDYWAAFAHTGNPGKGFTGQQKEWRAWQEQGDNLMLFASDQDGGTRMSELRHNVADIKKMLENDDIITDKKYRCEAYAALFLHGYQVNDFFDQGEYEQLGCSAYPVISFRNS